MISLMYEMFDDIIANKIITFLEPTARMLKGHLEYKGVLKFDVRVVFKTFARNCRFRRSMRFMRRVCVKRVTLSTRRSLLTRGPVLIHA